MLAGQAKDKSAACGDGLRSLVKRKLGRAAKKGGGSQGDAADKKPEGETQVLGTVTSGARVNESPPTPPAPPQNVPDTVAYRQGPTQGLVNAADPQGDFGDGNAGEGAQEIDAITPGAQQSLLAPPAPPRNVQDTSPIQEMWDEAYNELRVQDKTLVEDYERWLQRERSLAMVVGSTVSLSGAKVERREQMRVLLERKVEQVKKSTWTLKFGGQDMTVKDLAKPAVGVIRWADDYISGALASNPYASIAWAGVGVLLPLLLNPSDQAASLVNALDYISELIVRSKMREDLYDQRSQSNSSDKDCDSIQNMLYRGTLKKLYIEILKFQANIIRHLSKNGASRLALDMIKWNDWDLSGVQTKEADFCKVYEIWKDSNAEKSFQSLLAHHREQVENLSSISYFTASLLDAIRNEQADKERTSLLQWLSSIDSSKLYNSGLDRVRAGTGEWLLTGNPTFEKWKVARNSFIWLNGKAGCGKSILSSSIIKHLKNRYEDSPVIALAYFYFRFDDIGTQSVNEMLSSLIKQISAHRPDTPSSVQSLQKLRSMGQRPDRKTLEDALVATVHGFDDVYVVLDALDECPSRSDEREKLLESIGRIHDLDAQNLHFLCTSRREADIERVFRSVVGPDSEFDIDLSFRQNAINRDIGFHIDRTLQTDKAFSTWDDDWGNEVRTTLVEKADGMYVGFLTASRPISDKQFWTG
ncbi:hypothetical protein LSUE1_G004399 [Lachnellula suecica]|uniref:NACHT domain-containing protein n=1 Tax=Lachnellula suecica TaxID=602035 RepID=A0A8T9CBT8_9HELO|nr:hypothetical protein LSUE1_G004399 [Lachnellula suecica]